MKKYIFLIIAFATIGNIALAQDDDLPPPTSKPRSAGEGNDDIGFQGFQTKKKVDLSKFIIEPNVYLMISNQYIMTGFSPYVGYRVYQPANAKPSAGNTGLFVGGGFTYFYEGYRGLAVTDQLGQVIGKVNANRHTYGPGAFVQYNIWKGLFTRLKFELLFRQIDDTDAGVIARDPNNPSAGFYFNKINRVTPGLLLGAGYNLLQSKNFFFPVMVSYNLLHHAVDQTYSVYPKNGFVFQLGFITLF